MIQSNKLTNKIMTFAVLLCKDIIYIDVLKTYQLSQLWEPEDDIAFKAAILLSLNINRFNTFSLSDINFEKKKLILKKFPIKYLIFL